MKNINNVGIVCLTVLMIMLVLTESSLHVSFSTTAWVAFSITGIGELMSVVIRDYEKLIAFLDKRFE